jgi:TetR/AcrR family fatty acid metabolism transcriptional regulator
MTMEVSPNGRPAGIDEAPEAGSGELSSHDRLLQAARRLFGQDGYESTSTAAIARAAATSESQLIKHFGSKEGLLEAIFDQAWVHLERRLSRLDAGTASPVERLVGVTEQLGKAIEADEDLRVLILLEGRRIRKQGLRVTITQGFRRLVALLDEIFAAMQEAGQLRRGLNPQAVRSALLGAVEGLLRDRLLAERAGYPAEYDREQMQTVFRTLVAGITEASAR